MSDENLPVPNAENPPPAPTDEKPPVAQIAWPPKIRVTFAHSPDVHLSRLFYRYGGRRHAAVPALPVAPVVASHPHPLTPGRDLWFLVALILLGVVFLAAMGTAWGILVAICFALFMSAFADQYMHARRGEQ